MRPGIQRNNWPRSGSSLIQLDIEVAPLRVHLVDQPQLPGAPPPLDGVFAMARVDDALVRLVPDQDRDVVVTREAQRELVLVLPDTPREVSGRAHIQRADATAGEDIDEGARIH